MSILVTLSKPKPIDLFFPSSVIVEIYKHGLSSYIWKRLPKKELIVHILVPVVSQHKMCKRGFRVQNNFRIMR